MTGPYITTLDEARVAEILGTTPNALRNQRYDGKGPPYVRLNGRKVIYRLCDLVAYLDARVVVPSPQPPSPVPLPPRRRGRPTKAEQMERERARMGWREGEQS